MSSTKLSWSSCRLKWGRNALWGPGMGNWIGKGALGGLLLCCCLSILLCGRFCRTALSGFCMWLVGLLCRSRNLSLKGMKNCTRPLKMRSRHHIMRSLSRHPHKFPDTQTLCPLRNTAHIHIASWLDWALTSCWSHTAGNPGYCSQAWLQQCTQTDDYRTPRTQSSTAWDNYKSYPY